jgi:Signal peptide binding domain
VLLCVFVFCLFVFVFFFACLMKLFVCVFKFSNSLKLFLPSVSPAHSPFLPSPPSLYTLELDDPNVMASKATRESRVRRLARGSGRPVREVHELLIQYQHFGDMMKKMKGLGKMGKGGSARQMAQLSNMLPPHMRGAMGGSGGLQSMLKQMGM